MEQFKFNCPQCHKLVEADDSFRGQVAECPYCGKGIVIPAKVQVEPKGKIIHKQAQPIGLSESNTTSHKLVIKKNNTNTPKEWYYHPASGSDIGPVAICDLTGRITRNTLVWKMGMAEWCQAGNLPELASILTVVKPPVPPTAISDKWLWCLAVIPIVISWILESSLGYAVSLVVTIILNFTFATLDGKEIERSGRDTTSLWWVLLVPVYLFVRAARYSKRYAPAIVWCVLFALELIVAVFLGVCEALLEALKTT